jgi:tetratricopeptide (TPR) repeat protein
VYNPLPPGFPARLLVRASASDGLDLPEVGKTMSRLLLLSLTSLLFVALSPLRAQPTEAEPPRRQPPLKPASRAELDHVEALKLYALGTLRERQNRLLEALHAFEEARRLDPESASIHRALIPLYFALDRLDDALAACRRVLELDPGDFETAYRYARQLRAMGQTKEALAVLLRTADCPRLKERLEVRAQVFNDLAQLQEESGDRDKAEKSLREVLAILDNPAALMEQGPYNRDEIVKQAAEVHERLGKLYLRSQKTKEAIESFQAALKLDPQRSPRLSLNLAEVHVSRGEEDKGLAQVEDYLRSRPQGMEGYELRIRLQRKLGREAELLPSLMRSAAADPNNQPLQLLLAREYRKAGKAELAEPIYRKLLLQSPTPETYRGLLQMYKEQGQRGAVQLLSELDEAIGKASGDKGRGKKVELNEAQKEEIQRAAVRARSMLLVLRDDAELVKLLLPAATRRLSSEPGLRFTTALMLANLAGRTRHLPAAEELYRFCLRVRQGSDNEAELYAGLLTVLSLAHKNQAIIEVCNEGLKTARATNRLLFLQELAAAHAALGHDDKALAAVDEAVQVAGADSKLRCRLERAQLLSQTEHYRQALAECQALLKEYNQSGDVHKIRSVLSGIHSATHQHDKAEEQLLLILKDDPDNATANNDLGYLWADQNKKLDEAEKRIRRALELDRRQRTRFPRVELDGDRDNAAYVDSLGWVLFRKGDWPGARRELEKASTLPGGDDDPVVWDHLGDVYFRLKDKAQASRAWRKAIELYESGGRRRPDERYREIKEKLQSLP